MYRAKIVVPNEYVGTIMGDMSKRRGSVGDQQTLEDGEVQLEATVPQSEMFKYATDLRSMTQGRGSFSMEFDSYQEVPAQNARKIIESAKKDEDEDE